MMASSLLLLALQQWSLGPTTTFIVDAGQLISQQPLGSVHSKRHLVALGLHLDIPF